MIPEETDVLIIGGGPAGSLLGCMLARRGIRVIVAEKQATVERSFRGETLVSGSLTALNELGFGPAMRAHGYLETKGMKMYLEKRHVMDVEYLRTARKKPYIDMPQPALLSIINDAASQEPSYHHAAGAQMTNLIEESGKVVGAELRFGDGSRSTVRARLVVGADGRFSKVRKAAGVKAHVEPMDRDVLWFKVPRPPEWDRHYTQFFVDRDRHLVCMPTYPDDIRVAQNLPKRGFGKIRNAGLDSFKEQVRKLAPQLGPLMDNHLNSWDDTSFLEIFTAYVDNWARDGLVLIGDASHTCTPILGQGVNLAIQDCVRITPIIAEALRNGADEEPVPGRVFSDFVTERRAHKDQVTRFQTAQESGLAVTSKAGILARQIKYRILHRLPVKYRMLNKMLGTVPIDPVDLRAEPENVPAGDAGAESSRR
ncbi:FAD-dependent monooxygenase [Haloactinomyces albus]|uniref:2-polyprenyl-6-methoxyphenol hydroxylase-like FAD-dependent oxidoreductase n=1 Tax=Haloactinomyces albus TaxID=1352928 RepID=A0AAE3ZHA8_9ACTN|nr:FAD-dependent monooxygenase [Haloactinomyces albus]MDR7303665.1 2-polyprenyl-6-methoxyphenol hydroxylase-like FAD-dependent oxidoreductase [Haloactinomyces albus]